MNYKDTPGSPKHNRHIAQVAAERVAYSLSDVIVEHAKQTRGRKHTFRTTITVLFSSMNGSVCENNKP